MPTVRDCLFNIYTATHILEVVPPSATSERAIVWLQGPTYYGINCSLQLRQRPEFTLEPDHVMSVADEVAMGQVTLRVLPFLQSVPWRISPPRLIIIFI